MLFMFIGRLFKTDLASEEPLLISYTFKCSSDNIKHYLRLRTNGDVKFIALDPSSCSDDGEYLVM